MEQQTLFSNITPAVKLSRSEIARKAIEDRKALAEKYFEQQEQNFKDCFKDYFEGFLRANKGGIFSFPDVTIPYGKRKDYPQPKTDFRCTGGIALKYIRLGRIRKIDTKTDEKSGRIIPVYEIL